MSSHEPFRYLHGHAIVSSLPQSGNSRLGIENGKPDENGKIYRQPRTKCCASEAIRRNQPSFFGDPDTAYLFLYLEFLSIQNVEICYGRGRSFSNCIRKLNMTSSKKYMWSSENSEPHRVYVFQSSLGARES